MKQIIALLPALMFSMDLVANDSFQDVDSDSSGYISKGEFDSFTGRISRFQDWDGNQDGTLDSKEFEAIGLNAGLEDWDVNSDGGVDFFEYHKAAFRQLDHDEDQQLDPVEWLDAGKVGLLE
ncbi:MAG TPA: hypothetical protein VFG52_07235 [Xanthomonadales bacterium]|nr:hypothetical protein [Xanthomonadales bacterium]